MTLMVYYNNYIKGKINTQTIEISDVDRISPTADYIGLYDKYGRTRAIFLTNNIIGMITKDN